MASPLLGRDVVGTDKALRVDDKEEQDVLVEEHALLPGLPVELFHKVTEDLGGEDLLRASLVSATWAAELEPVFETKCKSLLEERGRIFVNLRLERHWAAQQDAASRNVSGRGEAATTPSSSQRRRFLWRYRFNRWSCSRCRKNPAVMEVEIHHPNNQPEEERPEFDEVVDHTGCNESRLLHCDTVISDDETSQHAEQQGQGEESADRLVGDGGASRLGHVGKGPAWTLPSPPSVGWSPSSGGQKVSLHTMCTGCVCDPAVLKHVLTWDYVRVTDRAFGDEVVL